VQILFFIISLCINHWIFCLCFRSEHFASADVHFGDRAAESARRAGHGEPIGGHRGTAHLASARRRADSWHQRRLARPPWSD